MIKVAPMLITILLAGILISCSGGEKAPGGSGLVEATEIIVSAEASGQLEKINFGEGDKVARNDIIAKIDTTTTALQLERAHALHRAMMAQRKNALIRIDQAALDDSLAQKEYERIARLVKTGSANQQQYDRVENSSRQAHLAIRSASASLESANAELARIEADIALLEKQLADCRPFSPATGTVITKYVEPGELIGIGKPILKIARLDTVWVKVYLPPADLTGIKLGDRAEVDPEDGRDRMLPGVVTWISSEAEFTPKNIQTKQARADLVYAVKVTVYNAEEILKIGMPVSVRIP
jgi:HlyD family secretion protein